jgi:hypothetical protein
MAGNSGFERIGGLHNLRIRLPFILRQDDIPLCVVGGGVPMGERVERNHAIIQGIGLQDKERRGWMIAYLDGGRGAKIAQKNEP